ncbi:Y4yA family PLP-dependent enzyme [Streptomyces sp. LX-29]|uniref:Y4yA family PLP-dependent enzyme n=1 Tax=Streptomyces sp. LX-29 TaxID=2900152 RepID=UPI00240CE7BE|nr:Y4yA family PLP-dependent enzyme [Streptomyces sp. LX-29]WFB10898.1 Y4yA family PLP-dependent enzyme [Streptomyces sp. LX-29]
MAVTETPPAPLSLPAHDDPQLAAVLDGELPHELSYAFGGPYHLLLPGRFDANAAAFRAVLDETGTAGHIHYAKKANKAAVWIERCAATGLGVDVASAAELREALGHGVRGEHIVVTGPAKADALLRPAVLQGCLITVDSPDELDRVIALGHGSRPARLLLRGLPPAQPHSRFGFDRTELAAALARCREAADAVRMEGFSFHLSGYAVQPRADLAGQLVALCRRARALGLAADRISIGGGFAVDYLARADWDRFTGLDTEERAQLFHAGRSFPSFYPYHSPTSGADALRAVLAATPRGERAPLSALLHDAGVALLLEPGRALLDRAGCTVFRVQGVKSREYGIVTVDGTSLSLSEQWFNSEFLPDPVLVPRAPATGPTQPFAACVGGASCLESDMLSWRKVPLPARPAIGDLLVYPNTAGYQMDSNESPFHDLPLPPKIVLDHDGRRRRWRLDRHTAL